MFSQRSTPILFDQTEKIRMWFHVPRHSQQAHAALRRWGLYWRHGAVYVSTMARKDFQRFLADLLGYYENHAGAITIYLDDRTMDGRLGALFRDAGFESCGVRTYLSHFGVFPGTKPIPGLSIQSVAEQANDPAHRRHQVFSDRFRWPNPSVGNISGWRQFTDEPAQLHGLTAYLGEYPAAELWYREEEHDIWIVDMQGSPFDLDGSILHPLLKHCVARAYGRGFEKVTISTTAAGQRLLRPLGFTDEVYWQSCYVLDRYRLR